MVEGFSIECREIRSGIALLLLNLSRSVIGPENTRHFFSQSDAKLTPITNWSFPFSHEFYF